MFANMHFLVCAAMLSFLVLSSVHAHPLSKGYLDAMPPGCEGQEYCSKNESYPAELIDNLLTNKLKVSLGSVRQSFVQRDGTDDGYQTPCDNIVSYDKIYEIIDGDGRVRFVIQSEKRIEQTLRLEKCTNPNENLTRPHWIFASRHVRKFDIACKQKTMPYQFLVLNLAGDGFEMVSVRKEMPVACICMVQKKHR